MLSSQSLGLGYFVFSIVTLCWTM